MGHIYMIILVLTCQTIVYREVTAFFSLSHKEPDHLPEEERRDPWSKTLNWYFFAVTNYFLYGESIIYYFKASPHFLHHGFDANSFTAYRVRGCLPVTFRNKSSIHQFYALLHW